MIMFVAQRKKQQNLYFVFSLTVDFEWVLIQPIVIVAAVCTNGDGKLHWPR